VKIPDELRPPPSLRVLSNQGVWPSKSSLLPLQNRRLALGFALHGAGAEGVREVPSRGPAKAPSGPQNRVPFCFTRETGSRGSLKTRAIPVGVESECQLGPRTHAIHQAARASRANGSVRRTPRPNRSDSMRNGGLRRLVGMAHTGADYALRSSPRSCGAVAVDAPDPRAITSTTSRRSEQAGPMRGRTCSGSARRVTTRRSRWMNACHAESRRGGIESSGDPMETGAAPPRTPRRQIDALGGPVDGR